MAIGSPEVYSNVNIRTLVSLGHLTATDHLEDLQDQKRTQQNAAVLRNEIHSTATAFGPNSVYVFH
jgi:hypothetical protein